MSIITINPSTEEKIDEYPLHSREQANEKVVQAATAYQHWKRTELAHRAECLINAAHLLRNNNEHYATLITTEMGKPINAAIAEITKCALICEHYAEHAEDYLQTQHIKTKYRESYVSYQPLGTLFAIMPWNFPFWQVFRFLAPMLMAGNTAILKHAPNVSGSALAIESLMLKAGLPRHVFNTLILDNDTATEVIRHPDIFAVTLTGSERAGSAVAEAAGKVLKKTVLELGGSDPYIILEDANIGKSAKMCVTSRLNNAGQVCIAAKRIIVVDSIYEEFKSQALEYMRSYIIGDPFNPNTHIGPLARADLRDTVANQVAKCVELGATCAMGGAPIEGKGYFYPPTLLENITPDMPAYNDEIFGPVVTLFKAADEKQAIKLANSTRFGLGGAVFTEDLERGKRIATEEIEVGCCAVNTLVSSDPNLPFGGIKSSGFGRELGAEGMHTFMNMKTIVVT